MPHGFPVSGFVLAGPVVMTLGSWAARLKGLSTYTTSHLSVSMGFPEPMIASQYPGAASSPAYLPAAWLLPLNTCGIRRALSRSSFRVPYVS